MPKEKKLPAMPEAYRTPAGRVVSANPNLHRLVVDQKGKYGSYVPCDVEGNATGVEETAATFTAEDMAAEKQRGIDQGWEDARAQLTPVIEKATAQAVAEAEEAAGVALEAAKAEAFESGKNAGLEEAKAQKGQGKKKGQ